MSNECLDIDIVFSENEDTCDMECELTADSGIPGASAYEIALANGFVGTEKEWLESLKGKDASLGEVVTSVNDRKGDVKLGKEDVGLGNVDNTSDESKPISTAMQTALGDKVETSDPRLSDARPASDVKTWAKQDVKPIYTASEVGAMPADTVIPTNNNQLANGAGFVTATVDNLLNYYKKNETFTKQEVEAKLSTIATGGFKKVDELPAVGEDKYIYLVRNTETTGENLYNEYIYTDGAWEFLGTTQMSLEGYATEEWVNALLQPVLTAIDGLSAVATTGSYNDLIDTPIIPSIVGLATEQQLSDGLANKVDKVPYKSLLADSEIQRLLTLKNYNDTELSQRVTNNTTALGSKVETSDPRMSDAREADGGNSTTVAGYGVWVGTQSEYDAIESKVSTTLYFIK